MNLRLPVSETGALPLSYKGKPPENTAGVTAEVARFELALEFFTPLMSFQDTPFSRLGILPKIFSPQFRATPRWNRETERRIQTSPQKSGGVLLLGLESNQRHFCDIRFKAVPPMPTELPRNTSTQHCVLFYQPPKNEGGRGERLGWLPTMRL